MAFFASNLSYSVKTLSNVNKFDSFGIPYVLSLLQNYNLIFIMKAYIVFNLFLFMLSKLWGATGIRHSLPPIQAGRISLENCRISLEMAKFWLKIAEFRLQI